MIVPAARPLVTRGPDRRARPAPAEDPAGVRAVRLLVAVVIAAAALKLAAPVLVPIVGGAFLAVLARPIQRAVADRMPRRLRFLGMLAALLAVLAAVAAFGGALAWAGRAVAGELRDRRPQLERSLDGLRARAERIGVPPGTIPTLPGSGEARPANGPAATGTQASGERAGAGSGQTGSGAPAASPGGGSGARTAARAVSGTVGALGSLLVALAVCALALAEARTLRHRFARAVPTHLDPPVLETVDAAATAFRRYAWVKTLTSALTGAATWGATAALGLPLPPVWGLIAFLLEYIPSVGSVLAVLPPTLVALAVDGPERAGLTLLVVGGLQLVLGNFVDPRLEGRFMALSPLGVLLSILVWGWLWGPAGALLAVPLTVAIVLACRRIPGARGLAVLLAGEERPPRDAEPSAAPAA